MLKRLLVLFALVSFLMPLTCEARVTRFVVTQTRVIANSSVFRAGPYERLDGTAYFEVDPKDPLNAVIVNLDKAPRNDRGMVEFSSPFFILKPVNMELGNNKIWYGINNRGNKVELAFHTFPEIPTNSANDPLTAADLGNNDLLKQGYTFVDAGWQGDVVATPTNHLLAPNFPVAKHADGSPIVAKVRIEYSDRTIPQTGTFTLTLEGNPTFRSYETADTNTAHSTLTVRDSVNGPKTAIASNRWAFGTCPTGQASLVPNTTNICLFDGFVADNLYELIYPAKNPTVMGLGYAVTRDLAAFLRYQTQDDVGNPNPLRRSEEEVGVRRAYSSGTSSTAMYQRDWLYLGFNEDERHRKVFDAVTIFTGGALRLFANVEFADPNTWQEQDSRQDFLSNAYPPLTFAVTTDPISGIRDGILKRPATDPLVFQLDGGHEVFVWKGYLNVVDGLGRPVPVPDTVRLYFQNSFSHVAVVGLVNPPGPRNQFGFTCQNLTQLETTNITPSIRALAVALDEWADKGIKPPRSNYPRLRNGTLVPFEEAREAFPLIPGVNFPAVANVERVLDFGPEFNSEGGALTILPPHLGLSYEVFAPKPDKDGLDTGGIRPMEIRVPLGTNMGWNLRANGARAASGDYCFAIGSYIPFATTKAERLSSGDPRESLEERYKNHEGFVEAVEHAAKELVRERFLLPEDAAYWIQAAEESNVLK